MAAGLVYIIYGSNLITTLIGLQLPASNLRNPQMDNMEEAINVVPHYGQMGGITGALRLWDTATKLL